MRQRRNDKNVWQFISLLSISKAAVIGFAILTSIALIINKTYQII